MKREKALYGSVSQNGGYFYIHYAKRENFTNISTTGYSPDMFLKERKSLPIIRYDKVSFKKAYDSNGVLNKFEYLVDETNENKFFNVTEEVTTKDYLKRLKKFGIPIEKGYI